VAWEWGDTSANDGSMAAPREEVDFLAGGGSSLRIRLSDMVNQYDDKKKGGNEERVASLCVFVKTNRLVGLGKVKRKALRQ